MYYTFRYTYEETNQPVNADALMIHMVNVSQLFGLSSDTNNKFTVGYHQYNGYGEETHPHFHIHFESQKTLSALRKSFQRFSDSDLYSMGRKGLKLYSLASAEEHHIKDINRFFRYPFKMAHKSEHIFNNYFEDEKLQFQIDLATTEYEENRHKKTEKRTKDAEKKTTYDKFVEFTNEEKFDCKRAVRLAIIKFYKQEKMACNPRTMEGYVNTYSLLNGIMTDEEFMELMNV
ncbi:MAG: putative replicase [Circular genetic element sp.]|nr:MAG: putative replicase [Circular genetic element sp.]